RGCHNRSDYPEQDPALQVNLVWSPSAGVVRESIPPIDPEVEALMRTDEISQEGKLVEWSAPGPARSLAPLSALCHSRAFGSDSAADRSARFQSRVGAKGHQQDARACAREHSGARAPQLRRHGRELSDPAFADGDEIGVLGGADQSIDRIAGRELGIGIQSREL